MFQYLMLGDSIKNGCVLTSLPWYIDSPCYIGPK